MPERDGWWQRLRTALGSRSRAVPPVISSLEESGELGLLPGTARRMEVYYHYASAITAWAMFERTVDVAVWIAFGVNLDLAPAITDQVQSVRSKLIMIENVVEKKGASSRDLRGLRTFRNSIEGITRERNRLVHDPHLVNDQGALMAHRGVPARDDDPTKKPKEPFKSDLIADKWLYDFTDRANRLHDEYYRLYTEIFMSVGLGPSSGKPPPPPLST